MARMATCRSVPYDDSEESLDVRREVGVQKWRSACAHTGIARVNLHTQDAKGLNTADSWKHTLDE